MAESLNFPRVVIIGNSGFIGTKLEFKLKDLGHNVIGIGSKDIDFTKEDSSRQLEEKLCPGDCIIILSALTPDKGRGTGVFIKNMQMVDNISKALSNFKEISHIIYFSSDAVYSITEPLINETTKPSPDDLYGAMHFSRELVLQSLNLPLTIVRPTLIYGAGDTHNSYGPNRLIRQALKEGKISLFGKGEETRSHIYIDDVINIILEIIKYKTLGVLNLTTATSISYWDLAKLIAKNIPNVEILTSERKNPVTHRHFDISKLYVLIPNFIFTETEEGIKMMASQEKI